MAACYKRASRRQIRTCQRPPVGITLHGNPTRVNAPITINASSCITSLQAGALLDEHLAVLAHRHRGTFFGRAAVRGGGRGEPLAAQLRLMDIGVPCAFARPGARACGVGWPHA